MTIEILTVLPELLESPFAHSIMKRAQERGHLNIKLHQLRNWAIPMPLTIYKKKEVRLMKSFLLHLMAKDSIKKTPTLYP